MSHCPDERGNEINCKLSEGEEDRGEGIHLLLGFERLDALRLGLLPDEILVVDLGGRGLWLRFGLPLELTDLGFGFPLGNYR